MYIAARTLAARRRIKSLRAWFLSLVLALAAPGCNPLDPGDCTTEIAWGVQVEVFDAVTIAPIEQDLTGRLVAVDHSEEMRVLGNLVFGAGERAGVYTVLLEALGYEDWQQSDLRVRSGDCHVIPVRLEARLTPASG
jgi:hypothetical protein